MKRLTLNQGSPEWLSWRRAGLGGSDIAAILGLSPYEDATRAAVFAAKVDGVERAASFAMRRGTRLEPEARAAYQRHARCLAPPVCVEHPDFPWARVSLDGLCSNGSPVPSERVEWVLELKCPGWQTHDLALAGIVAEHFLVQVQWQLFVCGIGRCDFASYNPSSRFGERDWLAVVPVEADPARQADIFEEAGRFWLAVEEARAALPPPRTTVLETAEPL